MQVSSTSSATVSPESEGRTSEAQRSHSRTHTRFRVFNDLEMAGLRFKIEQAKSQHLKDKKSSSEATCLQLLLQETQSCYQYYKDLYERKKEEARSARADERIAQQNFAVVTQQLAEMPGLKRKHEELESDCANKRRRLESLEQDKMELSRSLEKEKATSASLWEQLQQKGSEITQLQDKCAKQYVRLDEIEKLLKETQEILGAKEQTLTEQFGANDQLRQEIKTLQLSVHFAEKSKAELEDKIDRLERTGQLQREIFAQIQTEAQRAQMLQ